jgi:glycosyltransferase involved in cell wall biosynthesis
MDPVFSIIIPTKNRADLLRRFLPPLAEQETDEAYEIIVVDNGSTDETPDVLTEMSAKYPHLRSIVETKSGSAAACHAGALAAKAPVICFVDDDMLVGSKFVEAHISAHSNHPDSCVLGDVVSAESRHPFERMLAYIFDGGRQTLKSGKPVAIDYWSGNVSLSRDLYLEMGGYDQVFAALGYGKDIDFGQRLLDRSIPFVFEPEARTHHHFFERFNERLGKARRSGRAYGYVKENFPHLPVPDLTTPGAGIPDALVEATCRIVAAFLEPFDRGKGRPLKLLAYVYDLGLRTATRRGVEDYSRGSLPPAVLKNVTGN